MAQLNLFHTASVIPFPPARRTDLINKAADEILRLRTKARRQQAWDRQIKSLTAELKAFGLSTPEIEARLRAFHAAVNAEIDRRFVTGHRQPGGGAA